jgi:hypothetical protein
LRRIAQAPCRCRTTVLYPVVEAAEVVGRLQMCQPGPRFRLYVLGSRPNIVLFRRRSTPIAITPRRFGADLDHLCVAEQLSVPAVLRCVARSGIGARLLALGRSRHQWLVRRTRQDRSSTLHRGRRSIERPALTCAEPLGTATYSTWAGRDDQRLGCSRACAAVDPAGARPASSPHPQLQALERPQVSHQTRAHRRPIRQPPAHPFRLPIEQTF